MNFPSFRTCSVALALGVGCLAGRLEAASSTATAGQAVTLTVTNDGTAPFTYQWVKDGAPIAGATSASHAIPSANPVDAGTYTVTVTNTAGAIVSEPAVLSVSAVVLPPTITSQPAPLIVATGQSATFTVAATGGDPLSYQWQRNAVDLPGAIGASYVIAACAPSDAATYSVVVSNRAGSAASIGATLAVNPAAPPAGEGAPQITAQPSAVSVSSGQTATFTVTATGAGPLAYQWKVLSKSRRYPTSIAGATQATYTIAAASKANAGEYCVVVSNAAGSLTSSSALLTVQSGPRKTAQTAPATRLVNLSSRAQVGPADAVTISGFVVVGCAPQVLLLRGVGPGLAPLGVTAPLGAPRLTVSAGATELASNQHWTGSADADEIRRVAAKLGAFPLNDDGRDCAILAAFPPGIYTAQLSGGAGGTGVGLIEIYDADPDSGSRLVNLSTRAFVGGGEQLLMSGLVVAGLDPKTFLVRAVGPGLERAGVTGALRHPRLEIVSARGTAVAANRGWNLAPNAGAIELAAARVGAFPLLADSEDCALLVTLDPGVYTCRVTAGDGETGLALVEAYEVSTASTP